MTTDLCIFQESQDPFLFFENFLLLLKPQANIHRAASTPTLDTRELQPWQA